MNGRHNKGGRHVVDVLFTLTLFCVFTAASLMVILIGANVYKSTVDTMNTNFEVNTSLTYVSTKVRQHDVRGSVYLGTINGGQALVLEQDLGGEIYQTWIYHYDGALRELFVQKGNTAAKVPEAGQELLRVYSFTMEKVDHSIISLRAESAEGVSARQLMATRS